MKSVVCSLIAVLLVTAALPAQAERIKYYPDPVYERIAPEDPHPMDDMMQLAKDGDQRAQFIMGDLYSKGKGGVPKDDKKAAEYFNASAQGGYAISLTRLGVIAERQKKPLEAYKWFSLAADYLERGAWRDYAVKARDTLAKDAGLSREDVQKARKDAKDWLNEARKVRQELQDKRRRDENLKRAAERERQEAERAAKKAKAHDDNSANHDSIKGTLGAPAKTEPPAVRQETKLND